MIVKNIVITADEKNKTIKILVADSKMYANKTEIENSKMIDILLKTFRDDKIKEHLKFLV